MLASAIFGVPGTLHFLDWGDQMWRAAEEMKGSGSKAELIAETARCG
jgi:hypothetical protein